MPTLTESVNGEFNRRVSRLGAQLLDSMREVDSLAELYTGYSIPSNGDYTPPAHITLAEMNEIFVLMGHFRDLLRGTTGGGDIPNDPTRDSKLEILVSGQV